MGSVEIREAQERDVEAVRDIFLEVYGNEYPHRRFLDTFWLKSAVFGDDVHMLVAEDLDNGEILGTASVVLDAGAHNDLAGEFGRLVVSPHARGRGVANLLMQRRIEGVAQRIHVAIVENRTVHPFSQQISDKNGFAAVGLLPMKHFFGIRESVVLYTKAFGDAYRLRRNNPRVIAEAWRLASTALVSCELEPDAILDETARSYSVDEDYELKLLELAGMPSLLRIERGRLRRREIFGPVRLQYGFFKLSAREADYLVAHRPGQDEAICAALGFLRDSVDRAVRVFELIAPDNGAIRFVFSELVRRCRDDWGMDYIEVDVSSHAPGMQRTLLELGFLPAAYVPSLSFHQVERLDVVKMVALTVPFDPGELVLIDSCQKVVLPVLESFRRQDVLPDLEAVLHELPTFDGLSDDQARRFACEMTVRRLEDGEELFIRTAIPKALHILIEGDVEILGTAGGRLGFVRQGDVVGEVSLLSDQPHSATARAYGAVVTASLSKDSWRMLVRRRPDIAAVLYRNLARSLAAKLRSARDPDLAES